MKINKVEMVNGALLYHVDMPWSHIAMSGVLVHAGTNNEYWPQEAGLAHASEHMRFQGTDYFPNSKSMTAYIENVGGSINAWTSHGGTFFYQLLPAQEFERSPFVSSQLVSHATFPEDKIKIEMDNIIQEIKRSHDNHRSFLYRNFNRHLYGNHVLAREVLGNEKTVGSFTRTDFINFGNRLYDIKNFVFIVAGNVEQAKAVKAFEKYFGDSVATGIKDALVPSEQLPFHTIAGTIIFSRDVEQLHLQIGYMPFARNEKIASVLNVFSVMIDGGMSFPLFQIVRDEHGLCYEIDAGFVKHPDLCHFEIYVGTEPQKYQKAEELILQIINKSKTDAELLKRAKDLILGRLAFAYDGPTSVASNIAHSIIATGQPRSRQEIIDSINSVKIEEVEDVVSTYLEPSKIIRVILKPRWMTIPV